MNPIVDLLFTLSWFILLVWAIRTMARGCGLKTPPIQRNDVPNGVWTTQVTKRVHPEMEGVEPGEELMGVTFEPRSCDIEEYNELQERINELQSKLEDPWEDDDEDGGLVVRK